VETKNRREAILALPERYSLFIKHIQTRDHLAEHPLLNIFCQLFELFWK